MRDVTKYYTIRGLKVAVCINLFLIFGLLTIYQGAFAADQDETLRLFYWQAPTILNPHLTSGFKDMDAARITYEPLASFDAEGNLIPFLAAEIPSLENGGVGSDGKSVTWKLKPGVMWSDGHPFTADDVLFTYEFVTNPDFNVITTGNYSAIEAVEMVDDLTLTVHFKDMTPFWANVFVGRNGMILPRHIFEAYNPAEIQEAAANLKPVGTGPYRIVEYKTEDMLIIGDDMVNRIRILYEPNPFFWQNRTPPFQRIELLGGGDVMMAARSVSVEGTADFAWNLQMEPAKLKDMEHGEHGRIVAIPGHLVERILVNFSDPNKETETGERSSLRFPHPLFNDKRVRQALAHAINRDAIAALYGDTAEPTTNILVSPSKYDSPNTTNLYPFDLERAAELLDAAGWNDTDGDGIRDKNGMKMSLLFQTSVNTIRQQTQEIVKNALEQIGVEVTLKFIDASVFFSAAPDNTNNLWHFYADLEEYYTGNWSPDPVAHWSNLKCDKIPQEANEWKGGGNMGRWCHPDYDALWDKGAGELDPEKHTQLLIQMNDMVVEEVVLIPLVRRAEIHGISKTLDGIEFTPWDAATWKIKDWKRSNQ